MVVRDKTREIGILLAMGMHRGRIPPRVSDPRSRYRLTGTVLGAGSGCS